MSQARESQNYETDFTFAHGDSRADRLVALRQFARLLDSRFTLPGGIRLGWDGILGFVPGIGDLATNTASFYIILQAALLGCPPAILARMALNLFIDNLFDMIPFFGNFLDFFWRGNLKNVALLDDYFSDPRRTMRRSRIVVGFNVALVLLFGLGILALGIYVTFTVFRWIFRAPSVSW